MEEVCMRLYHVLAVVVILILGLGVMQFSPSTEVAGVDKQAVLNNGLNVLQMQRDLKDLPANSLHDLTFVFDADRVE
jgi:hypothetical protein